MVGIKRLIYNENKGIFKSFMGFEDIINLLLWVKSLTLNIVEDEGMEAQP